MDKQVPKGFCASLPYQPRIWDPSFLAVASTCWRKHWYQTVRGLRHNGVPSIHLLWGKAAHVCFEAYDTWILAGVEPEIAKRDTLLRAKLLAEENVWGETIETWRCTDPELVPAKRLKVWRHRLTGEIADSAHADRCGIAEWELIPKMIQNRDRCRFAKGVQPLFDELGYRVDPTTQCECGQPIERGSTFVPYDPKKTGETLIAAVKTYCDQSTSVKPYRFPDGTAALELQARLPLPIESPDTEDFTGPQCNGSISIPKSYEILVNIDSLVEWEGEIAIRERKTTGMHIESQKVARQYWAQFDPNIQIDTYDLVGSVLYTSDIGRPPKIMVEALNISQPEEPQIERRVIHIAESRRDEWFRELQDLIKEAEVKAVKALAAEFCVSRDLDPAQAFPRRTTSCVQGFRTCPFLDVCQAAPAEREAIIAANFHVERWVPENAESYVEREES